MSDEDILGPLRREFALELPVRLRRIAEFFAAWSLDAADEPAEGLMREAHKLAGTAGAMGHTDIGVEMCAIETQMSSWLRDRESDRVSKVRCSLVVSFDCAGLSFEEESRATAKRGVP